MTQPTLRYFEVWKYVSHRSLAAMAWSLMLLLVITCAGDGFAFDKLMSSSAASLAWLSEAVYSGYIESMLMIHWKDHMTRYFERIWAAWHEIRGRKNMRPDRRKLEIEISSIRKGNVYISGFHRDSCKRYRIAMPSRWKMIAVLIILIKGFKRTIPKSLKITNTWHLGECVNGDFFSFCDSTVFCFTLFHYTGHWAFRCLFLWPDFWIVGRSHPIRNLQWPDSKSLGSLDDLCTHIAFQFSNWQLQPLLTLAICVKKQLSSLIPIWYFRLSQLH